MNILATFNHDGRPTGFWCQDGHGPAAPDTAVEISEAQWQEFLAYPALRRWANGEVVAYEPTLDIDGLRQAAFTAAMAYGNAITAKVTSAYADVEVQSWTAQEAEARTVLAGGTLLATAMLPPLAEDKGVSLQDYAESVIEKADAYRQIAVAAVRLRRGAEGLLSEQIDTPEKLDAAVEALRAQTLAAAAALGIAV